VESEFGGVSHVSFLCRWPLVWMRHRERNVLKEQAYCERLGVSPRNPMECGRLYPDRRPPGGHLAPTPCPRPPGGLARGEVTAEALLPLSHRPGHDGRQDQSAHLKHDPSTLFVTLPSGVISCRVPSGRCWRAVVPVSHGGVCVCPPGTAHRVGAPPHARRGSPPVPRAQWSASPLYAGYSRRSR
jgi:hypothetical protein